MPPLHLPRNCPALEPACERGVGGGGGRWGGGRGGALIKHFEPRQNQLQWCIDLSASPGGLAGGTKTCCRTRRERRDKWKDWRREERTATEEGIRERERECSQGGEGSMEVWKSEVKKGRVEGRGENAGKVHSLIELNGILPPHTATLLSMSFVHLSSVSILHLSVHCIFSLHLPLPLHYNFLHLNFPSGAYCTTSISSV